MSDWNEPAMKSEIWRCTGELRFLVTTRIGPRYRLQQGWRSDSGKSKWLDVPTVNEAGEEVET